MQRKVVAVLPAKRKQEAPETGSLTVEAVVMFKVVLAAEVLNGRKDPKAGALLLRGLGIKLLMERGIEKARVVEVVLAHIAARAEVILVAKAMRKKLKRGTSGANHLKN